METKPKLWIVTGGAEPVGHTGTATSIAQTPGNVLGFVGGAFDINTNGPVWSAVLFFQDNDAALGLTVATFSNI
jgi:hypothetical protein